MKTVLRALIFTLLVSFHALGKDCFVQNGKGAFRIKNHGIVSLFEEGKSLVTHKVQDQDGLRVCYANTASVMLKSVLPGNPDISYAHLAITNSAQYWGRGGFVCEAIDNLKKSGGACPKGHSVIENHSQYDPELQVRLYLGLGKYFDQINRVKRNPAEYNRLKEELSLTIDKLNFQKEEFSRICVEDSLEAFPTNAALENIVTNIALKEIDASPCGKQKLEALRTLITAESILTTDRASLRFNSEARKTFKRVISDRKLHTIIHSFMSGNEKDVFKLNRRIQKELIDNFFQRMIPPESLNHCQDSAMSTHQSSGISMLRAMKHASMVGCKALPSDKDSRLLKRVVAEEELQCIPPQTLENMLGALIPLVELNGSLEPEMINSLLNPTTRHADRLMNLLVPGCQDPMNLIPTSSMRCETVAMCDRARSKGKSCYGFEEGKKIVRSKVIDDIQKGKALGVSVCTGFMKNPKVKTGFCKKQVPGIEGHPLHAMTVSGYRCMNGKIEYEILNSWGADHCPVDMSSGRIKNEAFTCVLDSSQRPTGRFWVKEDALVDNMIDLSTISKD